MWLDHLVFILTIAACALITATIIITELICSAILAIPFSCRWLNKTNACIMKPLSFTLIMINKKRYYRIELYLHSHYRKQSYRQMIPGYNNNKLAHLYLTLFHV